MKIIFAGTPEFSVSTLQALINSKHEIVAVYTQPDRPAGRGQKLTASPVKQLALQNNLIVCQPTSLRDPAEQKKLADWHADIMIVIAYGLILPKNVLETPRLGCVNVHASLLPHWRGAAPIQRAILAGDTETGITIMQMDEGLDTGAMLYRVSCPILPTDTSQILHDRLTTLGADALLNTLTDIEAGSTNPIAQDNAASSYAKKIDKHEAEINWQQTADEIDRTVRAFNPWPVAHTMINNISLRIFQAQPLTEKSNQKPGTILKADKQGIDIATGNGVLRLLQIQLPGARCLSVADVLHSKADLFAPGTILGK